MDFINYLINLRRISLFSDHFYVQNDHINNNFIGIKWAGQRTLMKNV